MTTNEEEELYWREETEDTVWWHEVRVNLFPEKKKDRIKDIITYCIDLYDDESVSSCPICLENKKTVNMVITNCFHKFCFECIVEHIQSLLKTENEPCCALCRKEYISFEIREMEKCIILETLTQTKC